MSIQINQQKCVGCGHEIMIARRIVEKNTKSIKKVQ